MVMKEKLTDLLGYLIYPVVVLIFICMLVGVGCEKTDYGNLTEEDLELMRMDWEDDRPVGNYPLID